MKITNTIYSSHLSETATETDLRAAAAKLAEITINILASAYPGSEIEAPVIHGVSGVGSGVRVYLDFEEAGNEEEIAEHAQLLIERATSNDEIWA